MSLSHQKNCLTNTLTINKSLLITQGIVPFSFDLANHKSSKNEKETPLCTSLQASYTVEATMVFPLFITFFIILFFLMRALAVEAGIQRVLDETGRQMAVLCTDKEQNLSISELAASCNAKILKEKVPLSYIDGSLMGIHYEESVIEGNYIDLVASYRLTFPISLLGRHGITVRQRSRNRKWIGWDPSEGTDGDYVYVTESGSVYHTRLSCAYLHPSIEACSTKEVGDRRNESGKKYKGCKSCHAAKNKKQTVYLTQYGETYHCSLRCSAIKRTIYRRKREEVQILSKCQKCGGMGYGSSDLVGNAGNMQLGRFMEAADPFGGLSCI